MSSADEEMRRLLDERGVEYMLDQRYRELFWDFGESGKARASAIGAKGLVQMIVTGLTPEQAVAATLGPGTCKAWLYEPEYGYSDCTICECGEINHISANYCNRCGRRIEVMWND